MVDTDFLSLQVLHTSITIAGDSTKGKIAWRDWWLFKIPYDQSVWAKTCYKAFGQQFQLPFVSGGF